jgi:hypothetical protein
LMVGQLAVRRGLGDGGVGELNASLMTASWEFACGLPWAFMVGGCMLSGAGFCACVRAWWDLRCGGWVKRDRWWSRDHE